MPLAKAIARNIFKQMTGQGLRPMALIRFAQARGGTYRKQEMLNDIRKFESRVKYEPLVKALSFDAKVPKAYMIETDLGNQGRYRVFGQATFWDENIEDYYQQRVSFYTDDWSQKGEYGMAFGKHFGALYQEEDMEFIDFEQGGLEHNKGQAY